MSIVALWLPILLSAVFAFIASSVIHMVVQWHKSDYRGFANEDAVRAAMMAGQTTPGLYIIPYCADMKEMGSPAMLQKFKDGPIAKITLRPGAAPSMGKPLSQWFAFCVLVAVFCAVIGASTLPAGSAFALVFRVTGLAAFMGFGFYTIPHGIWWGHPWGAVVKDAVDGLVYALVTAATFAWLWPH